MNEQEFLAKYRTEKTMFQKWGEFVTQTIIEKLKLKLEYDYYKVIQIEPSPRIKTEESIITKAFYRKEKKDKYKDDPYGMITDKVGTRFVVLSLNDLSSVTEIIENVEDWDYSLDKDFESEKEGAPTTFVYQSIHYVVRLKTDKKIDDIIIKMDTPCEIQIRTILQHAYSELTHDTIYKPNKNAEPAVHRLMARSMALIETTDEMFKNAINKINENEEIKMELDAALKNIYKDNISSYEYESKINSLIFDSYSMLIDTVNVKNIIDYYSDSNNSYIFSKIKERNDILLYKQPLILLLYFLCEKYEYKTKELWPISSEFIRPIYMDLGISFDH